MRKLLFVGLMLIGLNAGAQDSARKYVNNHLFEMQLSGGMSIPGQITGNAYKTSERVWEIRSSKVLSAGLSVYPVRCINAGIDCNLYQWDTKYNGLPIPRSGINSAFSAVVTANYNLPVRRSTFYVGAGYGYAKCFESNNSGALTPAKGNEWNIHAGYKLTLVRGRFYYFIEAARTETHMPLRFSQYYNVIAYPVKMGLRFRI